MKEEEIVDECYKDNRKRETIKRQKHISGKAVNAGKVSVAFEDEEFGDESSWNALCFGQSVQNMSVAGSYINKNQSEISYSASKLNRKLKLNMKKSFEMEREDVMNLSGDFGKHVSPEKAGV